jgi:dephospho-CoA kinase
MSRGGMTREEFLRRIDLQWPDEDKVNMADFVIHNNGTKEDLVNESKKVYDLIA